MILVMLKVGISHQKIVVFINLDFINVRGSKAPNFGLKIGQNELHSQPNGLPGRISAFIDQQKFFSLGSIDLKTEFSLAAGVLFQWPLGAVPMAG